MRTLETEVQPQQSGSETADTPSSPKSAPRAESFSPDPLQRTDRYRLVTPYRLAGTDRDLGDD